MRTLAERLATAARRDRGITFISGDTADHVNYADLHDEARSWAGALQATGVGPGDHIALLGTTSRELVTAIQAVWLTGATLVVLPLPMRLGSLDEFVAQTRARIKQAEVTMLLVDPDLAPFVDQREGDPRMVVLTDLAAASRGARFTEVSVSADALGVLQFTSGSTADPKGVMLPQETISANLDAITEKATLHDDDVMVSWLPLYHDMGLVGFCMLPMTSGTDLVLGAPQDFMARPLRWMEWMSGFGGTVTAGPNFSWVLATRALKRSQRLDLSRARVALNGAEPVDPSAVEAFVDSAAPHGFHPGAVFPAFGMAEVVIGAAFPEPMDGLRVDPVDRVSLESEHYAAPADHDDDGTRRMAFLGSAIPGLELRVVDPQHREVLGDRSVGELEISGTSVTPGYWKRPDVNDEVFSDGWMRTGDLAYMVDGQLVVCGRIKDVIIVGGRNVYPEEIERAVGDCHGVRAGNVIAFGIEGRAGKEDVVVVAETRDADTIDLRDTVAQQVRASVGVPPKDIVLVPAGTVPKTSSGKLQRAACKQRYLSDELG